VWSWGRGTCGQLGHGGFDDRSVPTVVIMENDSMGGVQSMAAGGRNSAVVTADGRVLMFGSNENGQLGLGEFGPEVVFPTELQAVSAAGVTGCAAGGHHTFLFTLLGTVFCFGGGERGQLGCFDPDYSEMPFRCAFPRLVPLLENFAVLSVSCGRHHTLVVLENGDLFTFGSGGDGQLGHGDFGVSTQNPRRVESLVGIPIRTTAGGSSHSLVLTKNGRVFAFGSGRHGALGGGDYISSSLPQLVTALIDQRVTEIAAGANSSSSRNRAGLLWTWGCNVNLTLGHGHVATEPPLPGIPAICVPTLLMIPEWTGGDATVRVPFDLLRQSHSGRWASTDYADYDFNM
jgi:alpha-tubulin suppressor-like RCC1 family protein